MKRGVTYSHEPYFMCVYKQFISSSIYLRKSWTWQYQHINVVSFFFYLIKNLVISIKERLEKILLLCTDQNTLSRRNMNRITFIIIIETNEGFTGSNPSLNIPRRWIKSVPYIFHTYIYRLLSFDEHNEVIKIKIRPRTWFTKLWGFKT